jgi:hypothetical protein
VVRQSSAKALFAGSIPAPASNQVPVKVCGRWWPSEETDCKHFCKIRERARASSDSRRVHDNHSHPMTKNTHTITFTAGADYVAAIDRFAAAMNRTRTNAIRCIIHSWCVKNPGVLQLAGFPSDQSLCGWVSGKLQERRSGPHLPTNPLKFDSCPLSQQPPDVRVQVAVDEDMAEAISVCAEETSMNRPSRVVFQMVRTHLIFSPLGIELPEFPEWQQLSLWVRAHIQARNGGAGDRQPTFSPRERFGWLATARPSSRLIASFRSESAPRRPARISPREFRLQQARWADVQVQRELFGDRELSVRALHCRAIRADLSRRRSCL